MLVHCFVQILSWKIHRCAYLLTVPKMPVCLLGMEMLETWRDGTAAAAAGVSSTVSSVSGAGASPCGISSMVGSAMVNEWIAMVWERDLSVCCVDTQKIVSWFRVKLFGKSSLNSQNQWQWQPQERQVSCLHVILDYSHIDYDYPSSAHYLHMSICPYACVWASICLCTLSIMCAFAFICMYMSMFIISHKNPCLLYQFFFTRESLFHPKFANPVARET